MVARASIREEKHDLLVVYVNYRTDEEVFRSVSHLTVEMPSDSACRIVVSDNSGEGCARVRDTRWPVPVDVLQPGENLGFGMGVNFGVRGTDERFVLVLNPDVTIAWPDVERLCQVLLEEGAVAVSPKLVFPDGTLQHSCRTFPSLLTVFGRRTPLGRLSWVRKQTRAHLIADYDHASRRSVDWCLGACILLDRGKFDGGPVFDERFFMYMEDVDLGRRIRAMGEKWLYVPDVTAVHSYKRESTGGVTSRAGWMHIVSFLKYVMKHCGTRGGG